VIYKDLASAVNGCDVVIGTTGLIKKANPRLRKVYYADELAKRFRKSNVCLVIGRDDIGLKSDELELCDAIAYIPAKQKYPSFKHICCSRHTALFFSLSYFQRKDLTRQGILYGEGSSF